VAQGLRQGVRQDVSASGLPSSTAGHIHQLLQHVRILEPVLLPGGTLRRACPGADDVTQWRAQSAVFLVHAESPRHAPGRENYNGRRASSFKKRMLSQPEHERPVTRITAPATSFQRCTQGRKTGNRNKCSISVEPAGGSKNHRSRGATRQSVPAAWLPGQSRAGQRTRRHHLRASRSPKTRRVRPSMPS
jgi:hypothetical protein